MTLLQEFKQFLLRGNVIDLAVGVVIGSAFGTIVTALVSDILTPFIAAIVKVPDFGSLIFTLNGSKFLYGHFLNVLISFILIASTIFFFVIKPINILVVKKTEEKTTKKCKECCSEVAIEAKRCPYCTQKIA